MKNSIKNILIYSLFFATIIAIRGIELPDRTHHYAIVLLDSIIYDEITQFYKILITVWHKYISLTLNDIYLYQTAVYAVYFYILYSIVKLRDRKISPIQIIIVLIVFSITANFELTYNLVGNKLFPPDMFNGQLSNRTIFWFSAVLSIYHIICKDINKFIIFFLIASILHPTSGVMLFFVIFTYLLMAKYNNIYKKNEEYLKYFIIIFGSLIIPGYKFILIKFSDLGINNLGISRQEYINSQYSNEGDDFSILYPFISSFTIDGWSFPFVILGVFIAYKIIINSKFFIDNYECQKISNLIFLSIIFWCIIIFITELIYITSREYGILSNISAIPLEYFINIQAGSKILSFIAIFLLSLILIAITKENYSFKSEVSNLLIYLILVIVVIYSSFYKIRDFNLIGLNKSIATPLDALKTTKEVGFVGTYSFCGQIYYQDYPDITNEKINIQIIKSIIDRSKRKFNESNKIILFKDPQKLISFAEWIQQNNNSKIIMPPYIPCLREIIFPVIPFFQEHDDGNLALGSFKIYSEVNNRMNQLGISYLKMPYRQSGYDLSSLVKYYDQVSFDTFKKISNSGWCKLIVKKEQGLKFPINPISNYDDWLLFDLCKD